MKNGSAVRAAQRVKEELLLLSDELKFFRDGTPADRNVLKKAVPGGVAGRISGLLSSLYDENELAAWITFSESENTNN